MKVLFVAIIITIGAFAAEPVSTRHYCVCRDTWRAMGFAMPPGPDYGIVWVSNIPPGMSYVALRAKTESAENSAIKAEFDVFSKTYGHTLSVATVAVESCAKTRIISVEPVDLLQSVPLPR